MLLKHTTRIGARKAFSGAIGVGKAAQAGQIGVEPAEVHLALDRDLAASIAGHEPDRRRVVLVGAGSLGSQVAIDLAREGALSWTVVDQDY
jgi:NADPH-dependent 2,4-dienoyl-CoA reductase/sulfur reductase-like enzyme